MKNLLCLFALFFVASASGRAAVVIVDFGTTNNGLVGYNEITALSQMATPYSLITTDQTSSGLTLSFAGGSTNTNSGNGVTSGFTRSAATQTDWQTLTGKAIGDVNGQGLAFNSLTGGHIFTLSGLNVGQEYSLFLLSGVGGTGGGSPILSFNGIETGYTYQGYDSANTNSPSYNGGSKTLSFANYNASGVPVSLQLNFTAASTNLAITIGNTPVRQGITALAITTVPEPSSMLFAALGIPAGILLLRRRF